MAKRICEDGASLVQGKYYLYNNLWGANTGSGSQCLWETSLDRSCIAWGTSWNWTGGRDFIKSYAAAVLGWHGGWKVADTGLPIQLSSVKSIKTSWTSNLTQGAFSKTNITYDIWLSENPQHGTEDATGEIMIWLSNTGDIRPIGFKQSEITIAGTGWVLWEGDHPTSGWPVYSFVRTASTNAESLDLMDFFQVLFSRGLNSSGYLLSVEAGIEVFSGTGSLETTRYSIDIESK